MLNSGKNWWFSVPCDLEILWMTLKNNRAHLLCYFKLGASFHSHRSIQTGVTARKRQIRVKIGHFLSCVTSKFDGWPWKTIGHLSYATSRFMHHFIPIGQFKLELQSGNAKFGSKSAIFAQCDLEIWWLILKNLFYATSSFVHHFIAIGQFKLELQSGNAKFGSKSAILCPVWH